MLRTLIHLTLTAALVVTLAVPAFAEDSTNPTDTLPPRHLLPKELRSAPWLPKEEPSRLLPALFVGYGALQVMDIRSTMTAIENGSREVNPVMGSGKLGTMLAIKAGTGAVTMLLAKKMAKRNKKAAIATMIVANAVTAGVVAYNYSNAARR